MTANTGDDWTVHTRDLIGPRLETRASSVELVGKLRDVCVNCSTKSEGAAGWYLYPNSLAVGRWYGWQKFSQMFCVRLIRGDRYHIFLASELSDQENSIIGDPSALEGGDVR